MPDLIAQGAEPQHRWRRTVPAGRKLVLGRTVGTWSTPWDNRISRRHAGVCWEHGRLEVRRLPSAKNPVFFQGSRQDRFVVKPGEHFVIGETTFTLADEQVNISADLPQPVTEQSFSPQYLKRLRYRNADQRIEALGRLPDLISGAGSDSELFVRLVSVLLTGIPRATAAAVVTVEPDAEPGGKVRVRHWDRKRLTGEDFRPSRRLILEAVRTRQSVVHVWGGAPQQSEAAFTLSDDADWAFVTPVRGQACRGWALYVAGTLGGPASDQSRAGDPADLRDDLKFTELAATTVGSLREVRMLQRRDAGLSQFFSPVVLEALAGKDPNKVLAPHETEVSVLFCDLRGFSRQSERSADNLLDLLNRVSRALGVTTRHILDTGGVVGDFHGDAVMGFWGWPLARKDAGDGAAPAALAIQAEFEAAAHRQGHPLADFQIGIGIATGPAVAGKIGTVDQVKVTVFGPVVNLASRLEGMTRMLRAAILLDSRTAEVVRRTVSPEVARVRRLAVVRPYGMDAPLEVSELLPPASEYPQLADEDLATYEAALDALLGRDWSRAFELLHRVPAEDLAKDFLTVFIAQHNRTPPENWDGVIPLASK